MSIWFFAGVALTLWVLYDLLMGYTYLWEPVVRAENPWGYWAVITLWSGAAISCFVVA
ncbi:hypothetical protein [Thalassobius sp. I31.1]|uniref:hypothetical protein n=1 Tax=Thalassobius sp. I31.1 TaxID=2109912 RepID=UPI0013002D4A|nr:hypothetical protein [Thalassobius sp. I31.1]